MKQFYQITLVIVFAITANFANANFLLEAEQDSVSLGSGYANDVYYSFENGAVHSVERTNWEIGFYTLTWSAGVIINGGNGVELYLYPTADTSAWGTIDTTGLSSSWPILYNSTMDWEEGAFNRHSSGHPDYGWGVYNGITHDVVGDSIYIIKYMVGDVTNFKKFWITKKISIQNTYYFKYANLDGSDEVSQVLNCNDYADKNFVYYSLQNGEVLDREPDSDSWDILFTKYMGMLEGGVPYAVTGALNNVDIPANRFDEVGPDFEDYASAPMDSTKTPIGHDWKYFDMGTFSYVVEDSIAFFASDFQKDVYKLVFSVFDYTVGKIVFTKSKVHTSGFGELTSENSILIYPNPATDFVQVDLSSEINWEMLTIIDLSGKVVYSQDANLNGVITLPIDNLNSGVYLVTTKSAQNISVQKLIIQ